MKINELIFTLKGMNPDAEVKIFIDHRDKDSILPLRDEHLHYTSEGAHIDDSAPEDEWDTEDGKIMDKGKRVLLINPIVN